jgi:excisionase family DNA binding protein
VKEAASRLNISSKKVYQMCLSRELRCIRAGGRIRIPVEEIEHHL